MNSVIKGGLLVLALAFAASAYAADLIVMKPHPLTPPTIQGSHQ